MNRPTAPISSIDTEAQILESLDFEIPCMVRQRMHIAIGNTVIPLPQPKMCETPAAWLATCRTCGRRSYVCEPHRSMVLVNAVASCEACHSEGTTDEVFTFTSLALGGR